MVSTGLKDLLQVLNAGGTHQVGNQAEHAVGEPPSR